MAVQIRPFPISRQRNDLAAHPNSDEAKALGAAFTYLFDVIKGRKHVATLGELGRILGVKQNITNVRSGAWIPSPAYMREHDWPGIFARWAGPEWAEETTQDIVGSYIAERPYPEKYMAPASAAPEVEGREPASAHRQTMVTGFRPTQRHVEVAASIKEMLDETGRPYADLLKEFGGRDDIFARLTRADKILPARIMIGFGVPAFLQRVNPAGWWKNGWRVAAYVAPELSRIMETVAAVMSVQHHAPDLAAPEPNPVANRRDAGIDGAVGPDVLENKALPPKAMQEQHEAAPAQAAVEDAAPQSVEAENAPQQEIPTPVAVVVAEPAPAAAADAPAADDVATPAPEPAPAPTPAKDPFREVLPAFRALRTAYPEISMRDHAAHFHADHLYIASVIVDGLQVSQKAHIKTRGVARVFETHYPAVYAEYQDVIQAFDAALDIPDAPAPEVREVPVTVLPPKGEPRHRARIAVPVGRHALPVEDMGTSAGGSSSRPAPRTDAAEQPKPVAEAFSTQAAAQTRQPPQNKDWPTEQTRKCGRLLRDLIKGRADKSMGLVQIADLLQSTKTRLEKNFDGYQFPNAKEMIAAGWPDVLPGINEKFWCEKCGPLRAYMGIGPDAPLPYEDRQAPVAAAQKEKPSGPEDPVGAYRQLVSTFVREALAESERQSGQPLFGDLDRATDGLRVFKRMIDQDPTLPLEESRQAIHSLCDLVGINAKHPSSTADRQARKAMDAYDKLGLE